MSALLYYLIILPLSVLPMGVLYAFSKFVLCPLLKIFAVRRRIIVKNIKLSFPTKSTAERCKIIDQFYLHLSDLVVESIKAFTISRELANSKMSYENTSVLDELYKKGKSVVIVGGHYGNWELLAVTISAAIKHPAKALYTPLTSAFFDKKMKSTRSKFGLEMLPINEVNALFEQTNREPVAAIFGSDQSPRNPQKAYWMNFLNQETGVQFGAEKFAKDYNCAVVYGIINRESRGHFKTSFSLIAENPNDMAYGQITKTHTQLLEEKINAKPAFWLWSHRRWKHKRPTNLELHASK